ncbi:Zn-dependent exopeptidase, partial [Conidiobolus coronatus NRRL 28638]
EPKWVNSTEYTQLLKSRKTYADLTLWESNYKLLSEPKKSDFNTPHTLSNVNLTVKAQAEFNMSRAKDLIVQLTKFHTRFFLSESGIQAGDFMKKHLESAIKGYSGKVEIETVKHIWDQPSFIVRFKGTKNPKQIVIAGAHYDSINMEDPFEGRSPGADDNGSGIASLVEMIKALIKIQHKPKRTIEFHFYSAEEVGLLGSLDIAFRYALKFKQVVSMLSLDMVGYKPDENGNIYIANNFVDQKLSALLKLCYEKYTKYTLDLAECDFPCSDHVAWNLAGYNSVYPSEKVESKGYHSENDFIENVNFEALLESAKSTLGFLIE